jgi:hypothetical protein
MHNKNKWYLHSSTTDAEAIILTWTKVWELRASIVVFRNVRRRLHLYAASNFAEGRVCNIFRDEIRSSEKPAATYTSKRRHNPEHHNPCLALKSTQSKSTIHQKDLGVVVDYNTPGNIKIFIRLLYNLYWRDASWFVFGSKKFESQQGHWLSWCFVVFLSSSKQILEQSLKTSNDPSSPLLSKLQNALVLSYHCNKITAADETAWLNNLHPATL